MLNGKKEEIIYVAIECIWKLKKTYSSKNSILTDERDSCPALFGDRGSQHSTLPCMQAYKMVTREMMVM